jgi:hypothetical protein
MTGPSTVGRIDPLKTRISGSQDIFDNYGISPQCLVMVKGNVLVVYDLLHLEEGGVGRGSLPTKISELISCIPRMRRGMYHRSGSYNRVWLWFIRRHPAVKYGECRMNNREVS